MADEPKSEMGTQPKDTKSVTPAREIKFRIWFEVERNMDYDPCTDDSLLNANFGAHFGEVVMQYTGLKDKNGVEIYEGDILAAKFNGSYIERVHWNGPPDVIAEVYWDFSGFRLNCHGQKDRRYADFHDFIDKREWEDEHGLVMVNRKHSEVIGNIYENPELLGSTQVTTAASTDDKPSKA